MVQTTGIPSEPVSSEYCQSCLQPHLFDHECRNFTVMPEIPCSECGVLYGKAHADGCEIKIKHQNALKDAIMKEEIKMPKVTDIGLEWPEEPIREKKCPDCGGEHEHNSNCIQYAAPLDTGEEGIEKPNKFGQALRYNENKPQMSYVTDFPNALWGLAKVMEAGARKYSRNNWKKGLPIDDYIDSLLRHLTDLKGGLEYDRETHLHQLFHIAVNAMMMAEVHGIKSDLAATNMSDEENDMAAMMVGDKSEIAPDGVTVGHEDGSDMTVAGAAPTAEDEPLVAPTDKKWAIKCAAMIVNGNVTCKVCDIDEKDTASRTCKFHKEMATHQKKEEEITPCSFDVKYLCEKVAAMGAATETHPMEIIDGYYRMELLSSEARYACRKWLFDNQRSYLYSIGRLDPNVQLDSSGKQ